MVIATKFKSSGPTNIYVYHNNRAWGKATGNRYTIVHTGREQGTRGTARIDNQLAFCLLLELLQFDWISSNAAL